MQYKTVIQGQGTVTKKRWNRPIWLQHTENNNFPLCALDEFHVYVTYNCERLCFDGKEFFDKVNVGDTVMVHLHCGYDKAGKIRHEYYSVDV
ncbi:MAG: hypothetical protein IKE01_03075 [Clostridia bacterium]|nr:hypothetical protein [Clostridia bacterium]